MLKYSLRAGKVLEISRDRVKVELFSKDLPLECAAKGCSACKSYSPRVERFYRKIDFLQEVAIDDIVKIESRQIEDGIAAMILFLTPLLFSAIFYHISSMAGIDSEDILSIGFAVFGGIFGFVAVFVFDKIFRRLNPLRILKE